MKGQMSHEFLSTGVCMTTGRTSDKVCSPTGHTRNNKIRMHTGLASHSRSSCARKALRFRVNTSGSTGGIALAISIGWSSTSAIGEETTVASTSPYLKSLVVVTKGYSDDLFLRSCLENLITNFNHDPKNQLILLGAAPLSLFREFHLHSSLHVALG